MIMKLIYNRKFVYIALLSAVVMWGYFLSLMAFGDPRMIDNQLFFEEMHWSEIVLMIQGLILTFILLFSSLYHSFSILGKKKWGVMILCVWPLTYVYAWMFYPNE